MNLNKLQYESVENGIGEISGCDHLNNDQIQSKISNYLYRCERKLENLGYSESVIESVLDYAETQLQLTFLKD